MLVEHDAPLAAGQIGQAPDGKTIWNLQVLRAIAATMVLVIHLYTEVNERPALSGGFRPFVPVWLPGGVDIFFIVSGFIMFTITRRSFGRPGAAAKFIKARLVRLMPPYWFFTLLVLGVALYLPAQMSRHIFTVPHTLASILLIPYPDQYGKPFPVLELGYTLENEALLYALFAIGLLLQRRRGVAVIVAALAGLALIGLTQLVPLPLPCSYYTNPICIEFLFGIGLAALYARDVRLPLPLGLVLAAAGVGTMVAAQATGWAGTAYPWRFLWAGVPATLLCAGLVLLPNPVQVGPLRRAAAYVGDASYALYLSHPFVLSGVAMILTRVGLHNGWAFVATAGSICITFAVLFFRYVENPSHRWLATASYRPS